MSLSFSISRSGFSLMELLIVIFIVSMVYFLGFEGVEQSTKHHEPLTPLTLKKRIVSSPLFTGAGTFICINDCKKCYLRKDTSASFEALENPIELSELEVYIIDTNDNLQQIEYGRYHDKKICLQLNFYPNGSSSQLILKTRKGIFFLPAFFNEPTEVDSLQKAQELWLAHAHDLDNQGDFY
jgi:prepilin-type N-terminal cleavage/methylation domain-containing protein